MRRENGTETIEKIKYKKLRKPFRAVVIVGYNIETGYPKRKILGYYAKASEANEALINYAKNKSSYELSKLTFKDVYNKWWSEHSKKIQLNTIKNYQSRYNSYLCKLNNRVFSELKTLELQDFFNTIDSPTSQKTTKVVLGELYKYAMKYEIVDKDYSKLIDLKKTIKKVERKIFTQEEIKILFSSNDKTAKAICVLIYTGMRIGEFLNLAKDDIENNFIKVRVSKTSAGIRTIPIHQKIKSIIEDFFKNSSPFLYPNKKGQLLNYATFNYRFNKILEDLGLQKHTIHDTRHTFASLLNSAGANDVAITSIVGHTDIKTTKGIYTHKELEELTETINLLK